ncbi:MAG: S41 family peptidase [Peptostreptococcaceae bacterium]
MKKKLGILFLLIILVGAMFQINNLKIRNNCSEFVVKVNKNKISTKNTDKNKKDISSYMYKYNPEELGISENQLQYITYNLDYSKDKTITKPTRITKSQAISDVDFIFNVIKYSYGGYLYFGGDSTFLNAKEDIINTIKEYDNDVISVYELEKLILENINFIEDKHFTVNGRSPMTSIAYYSNENIEFNKSENGYYTIKDGSKYYIKSIDNSTNIEEYLKLSINKSGDLCYYLGILDDVDKENTLKVILSYDNKDISEDIELFHKSKSIASGYYKYIVKDKIPVMTIPRMFEKSSDDKISELFPESANLIKKYPIAIMDIRGNPGGQDIMSIEWFKNYTGQVPKTQSEGIILNSKINNYISKKILESRNYDDQIDELKDVYNMELERISLDENKWYLDESKEKRFKNDRLIFIIVDECVASSGENFVRYLKTLDNVIVVGTNTSGAYTSNKFNKTYLPNSKIQFDFGNNIIFADDIEEGVGLTPDIWSNDSDILEHIITLSNKLKN